MKSLKKILLVDDSLTQASKTKAMLESAGYYVFLSKNGSEALTFLSKNSLPNLILTDVVMPIMDGFELCLESKKLYPEIPVIIFTEFDDEKKLQKAFACGATEYIPKPYSKTELLIRVKNVISMKKSEKTYKDLFSKMTNAFSLYKVINDSNEKPYNFIFTDVNKAFQKMTGLKKEDIISKNIYEVLPKDINSRYDWKTKFSEVISNNTDIYFEEFVPSLNKWLSVTVYSPENGYIAAIFKDITEKQIAKNDLALFKELIDRSSEATFIINPEDSKFLYSNKQAINLLGYSKKELMQMGVVNIEKNVESNSHNWSKHVNDLKNKGPMILNRIAKHKKGNDIPIEVNTKYTKVENREYIFAIIRDISKRLEYEKNLKQTKKEIENAHKHAMYMLALASEYKDPETGDHIKRIVELTKEIAIELGLKKQNAYKIAFDSILHDLGKLGISDYILLKPGKLTTEEYETIKQHTTIGAKIIGENEWFKQAKEIALSHHEHWDGSGYPSGLKGSKIPLPARIVAVADVFDALVSKRPYKDVWPLKETIEEIKKESGKHFDPNIVKAFISLYKKGKLKKYVTIRNWKLS